MPTIEPLIVTPLRTVSKIGSFMKLSAGRPTNTSVPPRASDANACSKALGETATDTAVSAPPSFLISATTSCSAALTTSSAPSSLAVSSFRVDDVDSDDDAARQLGVLDREVAKPATGPEDRRDARRPGAGFLDRLVRRDPAHASGAASSAGIPFGLDGMTRESGGVLRVAAILEVARVDLQLAKRRAAGVAIARHMPHA